MTDFSLKYYKASIFIPAVCLIAAGSAGLTHFLSNHYGIALSSIALAGGIIALIDTYLWSYWPCKHMYNLKDFRGRYEGILEYYYSSDNGQIVTGKLRHEKTLFQTGSVISIRSVTYKEDGTISSSSQSKIETIQRNKDCTYTLIYTYLNNGDMMQGFTSHYGTEILQFIDEDGEKRLEGDYYTDRSPLQTKGKVKLIKMN